MVDVCVKWYKRGRVLKRMDSMVRGWICQMIGGLVRTRGKEG